MSTAACSLLLSTTLCLYFGTISCKPWHEAGGNDVEDGGVRVGVEDGKVNLRRFKRDFMFSSGKNETDPECFKVLLFVCSTQKTPTLTTREWVEKVCRQS